jgi:archaellum component FlaF (FlaF/FlaG flagellin family)
MFQWKKRIQVTDHENVEITKQELQSSCNNTCINIINKLKSLQKSMDMMNEEIENFRKLFEAPKRTKLS